MPRAIWTGSISFGLVNVPVRMYSAVKDGLYELAREAGRSDMSKELVKALRRAA